MLKVTQIFSKLLASMKPIINTTTTSSIQKKISQPYESVEDWLQYIPDSADKDNLRSIESNRKRDANHYEKIEFDEFAMPAKPCKKLSNSQSLQTSPQKEYITILADTKGDDYTLGMTRSHSDTHLHNTGETNYTPAPDVSNECDSFHPLVNRHSYHNSLPNIPGYKDDNLPPVDVSLPHKPFSLTTIVAPMYEEERSQIDATSVGNVNIHDTNHEDYHFVARDKSPAVPLSTTNDTQLRFKRCLLRSCTNIASTISDRPKQIHSTSSLDIPICSDDSPLRVKSHSTGQVNALAALNQEVYSFIANSLHPEKKANSQPSLSEIFGKYCQNENVNNNNAMLSSECSSQCSSVELLSDNSGTASPTQQKNA